MKLRLLALLTVFTNIVFAQSYHDTQGRLEISGSGQATFNLPIAMPPSINSYGPKIDINYVSGQSSGIAGQGWNISGISKITRINTRFDIDGFVDGVDFDENDMLALDGQRLIIKTGVYWTDGAIYQTEFQSNTKIQQIGSGSSVSFLVSLPDGTKNWYGNFGSNNGRDITSYYIVRTEDTDGNFIVYNYFKPFNENLCIQNIQFSANLNSNVTPLNQIEFSYKASSRVESGYLNGTKILKKELLDKITVTTNALLFKKYQFDYGVNVEGYDQLIKTQEFNSNNEGANPILFEYNLINGGIDSSISNIKYFFLPDNTIDLVGDFNGDNLLDFVAGSKLCLNRESTNYYFATHYDVGGGKKVQARVKYNNKLVQNSALVVIDESFDKIKFKVNFFKKNNSSTTDEQYSYDKVISYNNTKTCADLCVEGDGGACYELDEFGNTIIVPCNTDSCQDFNAEKISNHYIEGDFNGDGLSEVLILGFQDIMRYAPAHNDNGKTVMPDNPCVWKHDVSKYPMKINLIDLDQNASVTENSIGNVNIPNSEFFGSGNRYVIDYNGDGKSDLLCFNGDGNAGFYRVLGFKQILVAPWVGVEVLAQGFIDKYEEYKQILFGDYNGDGKTDFMLPEGECNNIGEPVCAVWHIYYANPNPSFVNSFVIESHFAAPYNPLKVYSSGQTFVNNYLPMDINKDGKTDLVRIEYWTNNERGTWRTYAQIYSYVNYIGNSSLGNSFLNLYNSESMQMMSNANNYPLIANHRINGLETDLLLITKWNEVEGYYGQNGTVRNVFFNRNNKKNNLLKKIFQCEGKIVDEIFYSNMIGSNSNYYCGLGTDFYSTDNNLLYPLAEIKGIFSDELVSKVTNTVGNLKRNKDYKFKGLTIDFKGVGFLGFKETAQTSWYLDSDTKKTWSVTENDPLKRGALSKNYSLFLSEPLNFDTGYTDLISHITYEYETSPSGSLPYHILTKKEINKDYLTNVVSEKENVSYSSDYFLPLIVKNKKYLGTVLQGETTTTTSYENPVDTSTSYIIGKPYEINTTSVIYANTVGASNTKTSNDKFYYSNNYLLKTEKKANGSNETLVEEFTYFPNGLLQTKKVSVTGTSPVATVASRTTEYTYDTTNRFVKTIKAPDGLLTTYDVYDPVYGLVKQETNPLGLSTYSVYDFWGKRMTVTDFLGKSITYSYSKTNGIYRTTQNGDDGSSNFIEQDVLSREVKKGAKDFNGTWNYIKTEYDSYGRKYRVSEPYSGFGFPTQWTTTEFDDYSRPIKVTSYTGKVVTTDYDGLSVTATEPTMIKSKKLNALGLIIKSTDEPGGTITYKYDSSGNMLESDYDGIKMYITYDNWGRKESLIDTSVGTYTYSYDGFSQVKTETTPKGNTTYTYDDFGKILTKSIQGNTTADFTNITSTYSYDPTSKLLTNIAVVNPNDGNNNYAYTYDNATKQIKKTEETIYPAGSTTPIATFTKELTFDLFGRVDTEISTATAFSKTSTKTMKHAYKNGVKWQLLDGTTPKWTANTANTRGQLTSITLGNGVNSINITNSYDSYGYQTQNKHTKGTTNVMTLSTSFEPILGNLKSRYNSMFDAAQEDFEYDSLDRLVSWSSGVSQNLLTLPFNTTTDGFTFSTTSIYGSVSNSAGKLKVVLNEATSSGFPIAAQRSLVLGLTNGDKVRVNATITNKTGTSGVIVNAVMVETDPNNPSNFVEYVIGNVENGTFDTNHTVSNFVVNPTLKLKFVVSPDSPDGLVGNEFVPANATFYADNIKIDKLLASTQQYDDRGRITQNNLGTYSYDILSNHPYQNNKINLNTDANTYYAARPTQNITYNAFKGAIQIEQPGVDKISFAYNGMEERSVMYWGNTNTDKLTRPYRRYYSADGSMEIKATFANGNTITPTNVEFLNYLDGDAYNSSVIVKSDGTTQNYFYLHRDYQGSILAITNATGTVVEKRLFDPWGAIVKIQDGFGNNLTKLTFFDRGYTGHEHLESVGLIHMNARLYDPKLHRFLQADNFIQDINNTQNYNRYGYCFNNPLKYTDPSGNIVQVGVAIAIGVAIALATHIIQAVSNNQPLTLGGIMSTVTIAAFSSAATFGIGQGATANIGNFYLCSTVQAVAHGTVQGGLTYMQGGKFWSGFASGSISSFVSSAWQGGEHVKDNGNQTMSLTYIDGIGNGTGAAGTLFFGAISGGGGSALTGGNFWKGAATGLIVSGLNHVMHSNPNRNLIKRLNKDLDGEFGNGGNDKAPVNQKTLNRMMKLKTFEALQSIAGGKVSVDFIDSSWSDDGASAQYTTLKERSGETYTGSDDGSISVYRSAFGTYRETAKILIHEFGHAISRHSGFFAHSYNTRFKDWNKAIALDEVFAFSFQDRFGFSFYQQNSKLYDVHLQRSLNKL